MTSHPLQSPDIARLRRTAATSTWRLALRRVVDAFWSVFSA